MAKSYCLLLVGGYPVTPTSPGSHCGEAVILTGRGCRQLDVYSTLYIIIQVSFFKFSGILLHSMQGGIVLYLLLLTRKTCVYDHFGIMVCVDSQTMEDTTVGLRKSVIEENA